MPEEETEKRNSGRLERVYPQLFEHYVQGDVPEKVIEYGFLLAKKSLDAFSPADAIAVLQTVLDFLEEEGGERSPEAEARKLLAAAHRMMGNADVALEEMQAAVQILEKEKDSSGLVSALLTAAEIAWQGRKVDETRKLVEKGLSLAATEKATDVEAKLLSIAPQLRTFAVNMIKHVSICLRQNDSVQLRKKLRKKQHKEAAGRCYDQSLQGQTSCECIL